MNNQIINEDLLSDDDRERCKRQIGRLQMMIQKLNKDNIFNKLVIMPNIQQRHMFSPTGYTAVFPNEKPFKYEPFFIHMFTGFSISRINAANNMNFIHDQHFKNKLMIKLDGLFPENSTFQPNIKDIIDKKEFNESLGSNRCFAGIYKAEIEITNKGIEDNYYVIVKTCPNEKLQEDIDRRLVKLQNDKMTFEQVANDMQLNQIHEHVKLNRERIIGIILSLIGQTNVRELSNNSFVRGDTSKFIDNNDGKNKIKIPYDLLIESLKCYMENSINGFITPYFKFSKKDNIPPKLRGFQLGPFLSILQEIDSAKFHILQDNYKFNLTHTPNIPIKSPKHIETNYLKRSYNGTVFFNETINLIDGIGIICNNLTEGLKIITSTHSHLILDSQGWANDYINSMPIESPIMQDKQKFNMYESQRIKNIFTSDNDDVTKTNFLKESFYPNALFPIFDELKVSIHKYNRQHIHMKPIIVRLSTS